MTDDEKLEPFTVDFSLDFEASTGCESCGQFHGSTGLDYLAEAHQDGMILTEQPVCDDPGEIKSNDSHLGAVEK